MTHHLNKNFHCKKSDQAPLNWRRLKYKFKCQSNRLQLNRPLHVRFRDKTLSVDLHWRFRFVNIEVFPRVCTDWHCDLTDVIILYSMFRNRTYSLSECFLTTDNPLERCAEKNNWMSPSRNFCDKSHGKALVGIYFIQWQKSTVSAEKDTDIHLNALYWAKQQGKTSKDQCLKMEARKT